jgi:hypothetical protein
MTRLLTPEEIEALLASGPCAAGPAGRIRLGDFVEVQLEGTTVAFGHLVSDHGRLCVRVTARAKGAPIKEWKP